MTSEPFEFEFLLLLSLSYKKEYEGYLLSK
jgi:hypothetical protein